MPRRVELMKESGNAGWGAMYSRMLRSQCGVFQQCVHYTPGMLVTEQYGWDVKSGEFQKRQKFGGGLDPSGNWNFAEMTGVSSYGRLESDPSEWSPWPGDAGSNVEVVVKQTRVAAETVANEPTIRKIRDRPRLTPSPSAPLASTSLSSWNGNSRSATSGLRRRTKNSGSWLLTHSCLCPCWDLPRTCGCQAAGSTGCRSQTG